MRTLYLLCIYTLFLQTLSITWLVAAEQHTLRTVYGEEQQASEYVISADGIDFGGVHFALMDLDSIHIAQETSINFAQLTMGVLLQDGSWLPATEITGASREDALHVLSPFGVFDISLEYIAAWGEMKSLPRRSDGDVLVLANGNKPFGEIAGSNAHSLFMQTDLSDEPLLVPIASIRAARLRSVPVDISGLYFELRTHPLYPPLRIRPGVQPSLALMDQDQQQQQPPCLFKDWSQCEYMRIIGGNRQFLSEITPTAVEEKGLFGRVWPYAVNHNIDGSPLVLRGQRVHQGLVLHSYCLLTWKLDQKYSHFYSNVAISDALGSEGNCIARIIVDGVTKWEENSVRGGYDIQNIALDITDAHELSIEVDYGERYDIGDHCVFAEPYVVLATQD